VGEDDLQAGNSLMMGVTQLIGFVGPTIAGVLIGGFAESFFGVGLALAIDAVTFAFSALCLWRMRAGRRSAAASNQETVWSAIQIGIRFMWDDPAMRLMFLILAAINFLLVGPLLVGIPVLASTRLPEGAAAYGLLMSAFAGGNLCGFILAGALPHPGGAVMRAILVAVLAGFALVVGALGFVPSTWIDFAMLALLGLGNGYVAIILFTWMQTRTPKEMLGRSMSLVTFANAGLLPVSQAISGAVSKVDLNLLFVAAGALALLVTVWAACQPGLRQFSESLSAEFHTAAVSSAD